MPITLVTGLPGAGKTLYTLARWRPEAEKAGRPVFHNSIPGLNIPGWKEWKVEEWEQLPAGALFIVDEAQFAFPVTGRGKTPDWVQRLATHRHLGIDFVVITQGPMLLDTFVRTLVDRHFHVVRRFGGQLATVLEFPSGVRQDVARNRKDAIRSEFKYPREVFTWYKSTELDTVQPRRPLRYYVLWAVPPFLILCAALVWWIQRPDAAKARAAQAAGQPEAASSTGGLQVVRSGGESANRRQSNMTAGEYAAAYTPRIAGLPHTAPAYDGVTAPQQAPYPAACIASAKRCQCYSQQGTRLDMGDELCRQLADGGFFVAWAANGDRVQAQPRGAADQAASATGSSSQSGSFGPQPPQFVAQVVDADAGSLPRRVRRAVQ